MKRIALLVFGVLAVSTSGLAQTPDDAINTPLLAAPAPLKEGATVVKWNRDQTYATLRKGTNRLVCYDRSGFPLQQPFSLECTSIANLDRKAQNLKAEAAGDRKKSEAILSAMEKDGTRVKPEYGSVWYELGGPDPQSARGHRMIAVPGATTQSTGLPDNPKQGGAWIMNAGTVTAHIMIP
jgi:hypothetical protein